MFVEAAPFILANVVTFKSTKIKFFSFVKLFKLLKIFDYFIKGELFDYFIKGELFDYFIKGELFNY